MTSDVVFFDGPERETLLPLTYLRPIALCIVGMTTIADKWRELHGGLYSFLTPSYLADAYQTEAAPNERNNHSTYVNGACLPSKDLLAAIDALEKDQCLMFDGSIIAFKSKQQFSDYEKVKSHTQSLKKIEIEALLIQYPEDILKHAGHAYLKDYEYASKLRTSVDLDVSSRHRGNQLFIGSNVKIYDAIINSEEGPVYIDDDAEIMENAVIKGPVYIGKGTKIHVGAKIYAGCMFGPQCRIGGEVKRTTIFGYTNKAHDGYLGDSVLGRWCNLGADTNNSNMKNTYGHVSLWDESSDTFRTTDLQFLGMILGDHTMSAINTSFNTGTVIGIFCSIIDRIPPRHMPSFSWGNNQTYKIDKAIQVATAAFSRRDLKLTSGYESAIRHLAER